MDVNWFQLVKRSQQNHNIWQIWNLYITTMNICFLHLQINNRFAKRYNMGFGFPTIHQVGLWWFQITRVRITRKDDCYYLSSKIIQTKRSIMEILTKMHFTQRAKERNSVVLGHRKRTDNKRFVFTRNIWLDPLSTESVCYVFALHLKGAGWSNLPSTILYHKNAHIFHSRYHSWWWSGNAMGIDIRSSEHIVCDICNEYNPLCGYRLRKFI